VSVLVIVALVQLMLGAWNAPATSLGEVARREAARRATLPASVRALTNADIGPAPARPAPPAAVPPAADAAVTPPDPAEKKDEAWWRARITQARTALERDRVMVTALESRVAALTTDVTNRDDPAQRAALMNERVRVLAELDRMRDQVAAGVKAIAAIEDDARKAGVPAGWIR
jgi:hypothetical protein